VNVSTSPELQLLQRVHQSLRPALPIRQAVSIVLDNLPKSFIAVHLRIESDLVDDNNLQKVLDTIRQQLLSSPCLRPYLRLNSFTNLPPIFVASGVFRGRNNINRREKIQNSESENSKQFEIFRFRASKAVEMLQSLGFPKVMSTSDIIRLHFKSNSNTNSNKFEGNFKRLYPEQQAWVDLNVLRHGNCKCFIPAHVMSSFSYMAERLKLLDEGVLEFGTNQPSFGESQDMWAWGF